jgi:nucleoside-diphosphate-sugar epimerase
LKILAIGGSGYIGGHLIEHLKENGHHVLATTRTPKQGFEIFDSFMSEISLKTINKFEPELVVNLSWPTLAIDYQHSTENLEALHWTSRLYEIIKDTGVERFVTLGSSAEYHTPNSFYTEHLNCPRDVSTYALAKVTAFQDFKNCFLGQIHLASWVRPFQVYGPNDKSRKFLEVLIEHIKNRRTFDLLRPHLSLDWIHISDVVEGIISTFTLEGNQTLDLGTGKSITNLQICEWFANYHGLKYRLADAASFHSSKCVALNPLGGKLQNYIDLENYIKELNI